MLTNFALTIMLLQENRIVLLCFRTADRGFRKFFKFQKKYFFYLGINGLGKPCSNKEVLS
jgi:hypothetical protein